MCSNLELFSLLGFDPMLIDIDKLFFHEKNGVFFSFREAWPPSRDSKIVPLAEAKPCLSRKKKTKNTFFPFQEARSFEKNHSKKPKQIQHV